MIRLSMILVLLAGAAFADPYPPSYHKVVGVAADDTLSVRAGPATTYEKLGGLAPGAEPVEITALSDDGKWGRLPYFGTDGWVSMRYLAPTEIDMVFDTGPGRATGVPVGLSCGGTEPFWGLSITGPKSASYSTPETPQTPLQIATAQIAAGSAALPALLSLVDADRRMLATVSLGTCSDGMSDQTYPYQVTVWSETDTGGYLLGGCCTLPVSE